MVELYFLKFLNGWAFLSYEEFVQALKKRNGSYPDSSLYGRSSTWFGRL